MWTIVALLVGCLTAAVALSALQDLAAVRGLLERSDARAAKAAKAAGVTVAVVAGIGALATVAWLAISGVRWLWHHPLF